MHNINERLYEDIKSFCELNEIGDAGKYIDNLLRTAFLSEKYGKIVKNEIKTEPIPPPIDTNRTPKPKEINKPLKNNDDYGSIYDEF